MRKTNYHTHTVLCGHAVGRVEDYIKKAIELNMKEIGMSDHNPVPEYLMSERDRKYNWCDQFMSINEFESNYLKELDDCINKYQDKIKIYKGLECEYLPSKKEYYEFLKSKLDYLALGLHYYVLNDKILNTYDDCYYDTVDGYFQTAFEALNSGLFRIMVHPDLFFFNYKDKNGNVTFDDKLKKYSRMLIECAIKNKVALEINCGGIKNTSKYKQDASSWGYPRSEFFEIAKEYKDLEIVIGIDAHSPEELNGPAIEKIEEFAKRLNINVKEKIKIA